MGMIQDKNIWMHETRENFQEENWKRDFFLSFNSLDQFKCTI